MLFGFKSSYSAFDKARDFYQPHYDMWTLVSEVLLKKRKWLESALHYVDPEEVEGFIRQALKLAQKLGKTFLQNQNALKVCQQVGAEVQELNEEWLPTVKVLCNPYLQAAHWSQIQQTVNSKFNYRDISLNEVKYLGLKQHLAAL